MGIIILPPVVEDIIPRHDESDDSMSVDSDDDVEMSGVRAPKRARIGNQTVSTGVVTPGEVVTDDPQWMRLVASKSCPDIPCSFQAWLLS
jgi:exosome complex component RRP4